MIGKIFKKRSLELDKKIFASFMMPIFVLQMSSLNLVLIETAHADAGEEAVVSEVAPEVALPSGSDEKQAEPEWKTSDHGKTAEIGPVVEDEKYVAPQNGDVTVRFTKLPKDPGTLTIKEIKLTAEEQAAVGALSDTAYDISSDMKDGTFEYDLTLPEPKDGDNLQIKYAEDKADLNEVKTIEKVDVGNGQVKAGGLDHFTVFVVAQTEDSSDGSPQIVNVSENNKLASSDDNRLESDGHWTTSNYSDGRYIEFRFSPNLPAGAIVAGNVKLKFEYQRDALAILDNNYKARLLINNDSSWDILAPDVKIDHPDQDETFTITIPNKYVNSVAKINNLKIRFQAVGRAFISTNGIRTYHNYVGLDIDYAVPGSITIIKDAIPNDTQDFRFTSDLGQFSLDDDGNNSNGLSNTKVFPNLAPKTYVVTEPSVSGWDLTSISCVGGSDADGHERNAVIKLKAGENVVCTFTNTKQAYCGDGKVDQGEQCDDRNNINGDGCNSTCQNEIPDVPTGLKYIIDGNSVNCGGITNKYNVIAQWQAVSGAVRYEYQSFNPTTGWIWPTDGSSVSVPGTSRSGSFTVGQGTYGFRVRAVGATGNRSEWSSANFVGSCQITYDSIVPTELEIIKPKSEQSFNVTPILNEWTSGSDNVSGIKTYQVWYAYDDDHSFSDSTCGITTIDGKDGRCRDVAAPATSRNHTPGSGEQGGVTIRVRAIDKASNEGPWSDPVHYYYDASAPIITINNPDSGPAQSKAVTATTNEGTLTMHINNSGITTCNGTLSFSAYTDTTFNTEADNGKAICYKAVDAANNTSYKLSGIIMGIDRTMPFVEITSPIDSLLTGVVKVRGTVTDDHPHHYWLYITKNGSQIVNKTVNRSDSFTDELLYTLTQDGKYVVTLAARDAAGGTASSGNRSADVTKSFVIDNTAPTLESKTTFSGWYNSLPQTSTFNYVDANMAGDYVAPTCQITSEGADQTCTVTPDVCDAAGNCNTTPVTSNGANIDLTKPASTIDGGENNGVVYANDWDGTLSGTAEDALSGVSGVDLVIKRDIEGVITYWNGIAWQSDEASVLAGTSNAWANWNYTLNALPLEDGKYTIESHATDNAGNTENTYTLTIVFDKTIPTVALSIDPASPNGDNDWYVTHPTVTLTASDANLDKIEYQLDSTTGAWTTYVSPIEIPDGKHVFYYRSLDLAANYSEIGVKNVKVDTQDPPTVKSVKARYDEGQHSVKLNWDASDDDIYKVYVYKGDKKNFAVNSGSRIAKNSHGNDDLTDNDVSRGEKYYYKFISVDEAGNKSDTKIISVRIPQNGGAPVVTDEGTQSTPRGEVAGANAGENQEGQEQEGQNVSGGNGQDNGGGQVEGASTTNDDGAAPHHNWWWWILAAIIAFLLGAEYRRRKKKMSLPKMD